MSDFHDLVDSYFSYFDELRDDPSFGLMIPNRKPDISEEVEWFSDLCKSHLNGNVVVSIAAIDRKVVGSAKYG